MLSNAEELCSLYNLCTVVSFDRNREIGMVVICKERVVGHRAAEVKFMSHVTSGGAAADHCAWRLVDCASDHWTDEAAL